MGPVFGDIVDAMGKSNDISALSRMSSQELLETALGIRSVVTKDIPAAHGSEFRVNISAAAIDLIGTSKQLNASVVGLMFRIALGDDERERRMAALRAGDHLDPTLGAICATAVVESKRSDEARFDALNTIFRNSPALFTKLADAILADLSEPESFREMVSELAADLEKLEPEIQPTLTEQELALGLAIGKAVGSGSRAQSEFETILAGVSDPVTRTAVLGAMTVTNDVNCQRMALELLSAEQPAFGSALKRALVEQA